MSEPEQKDQVKVVPGGLEPKHEGRAPGEPKEGKTSNVLPAGKEKVGPISGRRQAAWPGKRHSSWPVGRG